VPSSSGPRVFVVDDEPVIASTLAAILQMHGFSAKFFTSPLEALAAARAKSPDLLISDVDMPSISGIELAIRIKALHPTCQILLFSGQASTLDLLNSARAQGHDFDLLLKPVPPPALLAEIRKRIRCASDVRSGSQAKVDEPQRSMASSGVSASVFQTRQIRGERNHKLD
jgi:CheY-like chemotaxis protein